LVFVVQGISRHPGVEGHPELRAEAAYRDGLLLRAVEGERDEPGVERRGVEIAGRLGLQIVARRQVAQAGRLRDFDARCGAPSRGRIAGPRGSDRHQRQQHGLAGLHNPGVPLIASPAAALIARSLVPLGPLGLLGLLAVLVELLTGLDGTQAFRHGRSPTRRAAGA
jgi:hypothetical protein